MRRPCRHGDTLCGWGNGPQRRLVRIFVHRLRGDTWFAAKFYCVLRPVDRDDGFFDGSTEVIFYGAGRCYAAAGPILLRPPAHGLFAIQPQATLGFLSGGEWTIVFIEMRRTDFTSRFGYAPKCEMPPKQRCYFMDQQFALRLRCTPALTRPNAPKLPHAGRMGSALPIQS